MGAWRYIRDSSEAFSEYGSWSGDRLLPLRPHFHSKAQLSAVVTGCRAIRVGTEVFAIGPGECFYVPPGCLHQTLPTAHPDTWCLNAYAPAPVCGDLPKVLRFDRSLRNRVSPETLFSSLSLDLRRYAAPRGLAPKGGGRRFCLDGRVAEIAALYGISREHFSRRFRRDFGVGPYAYSLMQRLDEGRQRLRTRQPIAAVAADLGFIDQSHFGRLFRETYGTTPRQYTLSLG